MRLMNNTWAVMEVLFWLWMPRKIDEELSLNCYMPFSGKSYDKTKCGSNLVLYNLVLYKL